jgi:glycogen operon protein
MLLAGDELGRTQGGNNNSYCQDNEISWVDWDAAAKHLDLIEFVAALSALRKAHPLLRRRRFFSGQAGASNDGQRDIIWLSPSGAEMTGHDWNSGYAKSLAVCVNGDAITEPGPRGERITDSDFVLLINAHSDPVTFTIPPGVGSPDVTWHVVVDTGSAQPMAVAPGHVTGFAPAGVGHPVGGQSGQSGQSGFGQATDAPAVAEHTVEVASRAMVVLCGTRP